MRVVIQKKPFKGNPVGSVVNLAHRTARVLIAVGLATPFQPEATDPEQAEAERRAAEQAAAEKAEAERQAAERAAKEKGGKPAGKAEKPPRGRYMRRDLQAK